MARLSGMPPHNQPAIFASLAMVVGLHEVIYFEVARAPERGWLLAAVGLPGKILGPIGLAVLIARGEWPPSTIVLSLTNDLIWWIPFTIFVRDAWDGIATSSSARRDTVFKEKACLTASWLRSPKTIATRKTICWSLWKV